MAAGFDPYYTWLGIPPEEQPPHVYRLLGVKPLEENHDVIEHAADRQMKHLRDFQGGKHGELSQKILNEIAAAKVTLLDPAKKSAYDADLRAQLSAAKQAEIKKIREERPLPTAKPIAVAAPLEAQPAMPSPVVQITAPQPSVNARAATNVAPLIVIGLIALVLLAVGGVAAVLFLGDADSAVAVNTNPYRVPTRTTTLSDELPIAASTPPVAEAVVLPPPNNEKPTSDPPSTPTADRPVVDDRGATTDLPLPSEVKLAAEASSNDEEQTLIAAADEPGHEAPKKLPVPEKAEREAKRNEIASIFEIAQARTFEQKSELAAKLIRTAGDSVDDPAAVFALLNIAREQAAEAGQIKLAFAATDILGETFDFDAAAVRVASLQQAARAQLPPAMKREIVIAGIDVIGELSNTDQFDEADALSDRMLPLARALRDTELIKSLLDQRRTVGELAASFKKAQVAFQTLASSPDDAEACLVAGKYLAFVKQDWDRGLAYLAKGSDTDLAAAASAELAAPETPADREKLASAWWSASETQKEQITIDQCRFRAAEYYASIIGTLSGLEKVKAEQRIAQVRQNPDAVAVTPIDRFEPGLLVSQFSRLSSQSGNNGYVHPAKLGEPTESGRVLTSLTKWQYDAEKNAIAVGFLKVETEGVYAFRTYNYYDRNALFVNDQLVCRYRGSTSGGSDDKAAGREEKIMLPRGYVPIVCVGYVDARGMVNTVVWRVPGTSDFVPIPSELLFHR